ncbi:nitrilase-related carbon-nitrogen hydrolase [Deinococcus peraridilitoris]|uniref:Putative amidohydrolase n=1 Tax=Deinococcus peraridilitoris (strain DSM 19664 / LMG 22246 / CIP 109416 / KR-200) TaxID=937777 RepID=L0A2R3_DEIPD|nr:nitrilase-related carbon-nitrogen hydrolase [Deinococcus peraridilitoris]AFZ67734.1 putative amidohydrolase [Deinococcus peraridilitoris DSM 19664]
MRTPSSSINPGIGRLAPSRVVRAIAVQPQWRVRDFRSRESFRVWMRAQLEHSRPHLAPDRPNLVVLTELNGLPLLLRGARMAQRAPTLDLALGLTIIKHGPATLYCAMRQRVSLPRALQLVLAPRLAADYLSVSRDLAREYGVYLLAGTAPLPHFVLQGSRLVVQGSQVYNQAVLISPEGELIGLADKVHLTTGEGPSGLDLSPGKLADLRVFATPAGELGIATSLDAFREDVITHLDAQGASVLLQPDANAGPWTGMEQEPPTGRNQPEAWLDSAWAAVQRARNIRYAVNPMVVGNLFDVAFDGQSAIVAKASQAPQLRSYVMTEPRAGFLALQPWVTQGTPEELRRAGLELAPRSGAVRENRYRTAVLAADLPLSAPIKSPLPLRPFEEAVNGYLLGRAALRQDPAVQTLGALWRLLGVGVLLTGARLVARRRKRGLVLTLLGASITVLGWF